MDRESLEFQFGGPDARDDAESLADFLRSDFADWPTRIVERPAAQAGQPTMRGDTLAILALLLALPGALKNAFDLAERIQLKAKFDRLLAWARQRRAAGRRVPTVVLPRTQRTVPLDEVRVEEVLDTIAADAAPQRGPQP